MVDDHPVYNHPAIGEQYDQCLDQYGEPDHLLITVSGPTAAGTTAIAGYIADELDVEHRNVGEFLRDWATDHGYSVEEFESRPGEIIDEIGENPDIAGDQRAIEYAFSGDDAVLEGRLTGVFLQDVAPIRVYVDCDPATAAPRIIDREEQLDTVMEAEEYIQERRENIPARYEELYGINPWDADVYNVHIDNSQPLDAVKEAVRNELNAFTSLDPRIRAFAQD